MLPQAVVFAYHNVGYRCLSVLLAQGVRVALVITHRDHPDEHIWFESVAALAARHGIACITPDDPHDAEMLARIRAIAPEFLFSFYYRYMLDARVLALASRGAYNMHGSLLPKYRGRVPVNWAILHGEQETGATLHEMTAKPDAGRIVDQQAVPILPDDTAREVFDKVTVAAEMVLYRSLPGLLAGTIIPRAQDLAAGSYYGRRTPADGRIDPSLSAARIHNLVRAVAPPYPGAFIDLNEGCLMVLRTQHCEVPAQDTAALYTRGEDLYLSCIDGRSLRILDARLDDTPIDAPGWRARFGATPFPLSQHLPQS